jgi:hypothetical protein
LIEETAMRFVKANPNEYLVVGRQGRIRNKGLAASALLWPGSTCVLIPSTQQEATFEMTQESKDGVPLRFKGIVIYRVIDAETAARRFDFAGGDGHEQIKALLAHVCLGELRGVVAGMTMEECVGQRKTTLTDAVARALGAVIRGTAQEPGWGVDLDVVQVAQVFIVDQELRRQLEAGVRNAIKVKSELSEIEAREGIQIAQSSSQRRLQQEGLAAERERVALAREKLHLAKELERAEIEADTPNRLLRLEEQEKVLGKEKAKYQLEVEVRELAVRLELLAERARLEMRKEILPVEQAPEIARALSRLLQGTRLSFYGQDGALLGSLTPLLDLLTDAVRKGR